MRVKWIVLVAASAAFGASLAGSFYFDDYAILADPALTSPSGFWEVWRPLQTRPLTYFTFWLDYQLGGAHPLGYHLVNLALHLAVVWLLFGLLEPVMPRKAAVVAVALFAVHPIQTEAVAYVFARGSLLATLFCLLSWQSWYQGARWRAAACFVVALLAKEECVAFPLVLLLAHIVQKRDRRERLPMAVMLAASLAAGLRVFAALDASPGAPAGPRAGISPLDYLAAQGPVILRYFRLLLVPWGFTVDPDIRVPTPWWALLAWAVIGAAALSLAARLRRHPAAFWTLAGLILLAPSSSVFPAADLAADRRMYLPMIALAAAAGLLLERLDRRILVAAGAVLVLLSIQRSLVWRTGESLWGEAVARAPMKVRPRIQLARAVAPSRGVELLREAKTLAPDDAAVAAELGRAWLAWGRPAEALAEFGRALALAPNDPQAINNRGVALSALRQTEAARQDFERALRINPCLFEARLNLLQMKLATPQAAGCRYTAGQRKLLTAPIEAAVAR